MRKSIFIITMYCFYTISSLTAQEQYRHEFSLGGGAGLSTLQYSPSMGEKTLFGFGGTIGLGYTFFFSPQWGLGTGVELGFYNSKTTADNLQNQYLVSPNPTGLPDNFYFRSNYSGYEETQSATFVNIPLMLQFQTKGKHKFYAALGGKLGIPVSASYEISSTSLTTSGYSDFTNQTYENMPSHGFQTNNDQGSTGDLEFDMAYMASVELGMKWRLANRWSLYTGIYADYGFNDIRSNEANQNMIEYNPANPTEYTYNSITQSLDNGNAIVDKVSPLAVGLKIKIAIGTGRDLTQQKVEQPQVVKDNSEELAAAERAKQEEQAEQQRLAQEAAAKQQALAEEAKRRQAQEEAQRLAAAKAEAAKQQAATKANIEEPVKNYKKDQEQPTESQKKEFDERIVLLQENPNIQIFIYGHTCDIGDDAINEKVGLQRAEKAKKYLIDKGISENRILGTASQRDTEPLVANTNEENRLKNRRVVLMVKE